MLLQLLLQRLKKQTQLIDIQFVGYFTKWNWGESNPRPAMRLLALSTCLG